jgi:hypothetical protein
MTPLTPDAPVRRPTRSEQTADRAGLGRSGARMRRWRLVGVEEDTMGKTGRKRRARKKKGANHGKRPNA